MRRCLFLALLLTATTVQAATNWAYNQVVTIAANTDTTFSFTPQYTTVSTTVTVSILTAPKTGTLYGVAPNWVNYGYTPAKWGPVSVSSLPASLSSNANSNTSAVYSCSGNCVADRIMYTITDSSVNSTASNVAYIDFVLADTVLSANHFLLGSETWTVVPAGLQSAALTATALAWSIDNGLLNHFVVNPAIPLVVQPGANNALRWYFDKMLTTPLASLPTTATAARTYYNSINLYGGTVSFSMASLAGDFTTLSNQRTLPINMIQLVCASCTAGSQSSNGLAVAIRNVQFQGTATNYNFALTETGGWLKNPFSIATPQPVWVAPTACEMLYLLSGLSEIRIYGRWTNSYEVIAIDEVVFTTGAVPLSYYTTTAQPAVSQTDANCAAASAL